MKPQTDLRKRIERKRWIAGSLWADDGPSDVALDIIETVLAANPNDVFHQQEAEPGEAGRVEHKVSIWADKPTEPCPKCGGRYHDTYEGRYSAIPDADCPTCHGREVVE